MPNTDTGSIFSIDGLSRAYHAVNNTGLRVFGRGWLNQYFGPIYPGIVAHNSNRSFKGLFFGFGLDFSNSVKLGKGENAFFEESGLRDLALISGGMCTFWMGATPAIYVASTKIKILNEGYLEPNSLRMFDYVGQSATSSLPVGRLHSRNQGIFLEFGKKTFIDRSLKTITERSEQFLDARVEQALDLFDFFNAYVLDVTSHIPGLMDLTKKPLNDYTGATERVIDDL